MQGNRKTIIEHGPTDPNDGLPINVQVNTVMTNIQTINSEPPILQYSEPRIQAFLKQCEKYSCSIIRFYCDSWGLPLWIPTIQLNQTNPLLTIYSVTLEWVDGSGNAYTQQSYLNYVPQVEAISTQSKQSGVQQNNSSLFYNVYSMSALVSMFNTTFATCMTALNATVTGAGKTLPSTNPPVITIDFPSNICTINLDFAGYNDLSSNYIRVYMNPASFNLFNSFPFKVFSWSDTAANGTNFRLVVNSYGGQTITQFPSYSPSYDVYQVAHEFDSLTTAVNPVTSFTICSY